MSPFKSVFKPDIILQILLDINAIFDMVQSKHGLGTKSHNQTLSHVGTMSEHEVKLVGLFHKFSQTISDEKVFFPALIHKIIYEPKPRKTENHYSPTHCLRQTHTRHHSMQQEYACYVWK